MLKFAFVMGVIVWLIYDWLKSRGLWDNDRN